MTVYDWNTDVNQNWTINGVQIDDGLVGYALPYGLRAVMADVATFTGSDNTKLTLGAANATFEIVRPDTLQYLGLSGGTSVSSSANIVLWGDGSSAANDIALRNATTNLLLWDMSDDQWEFKKNVDFDSKTLSGIGQLNVDNLRADANTLSSTNIDGNITLDPNGSGQVLSADNSSNVDVTVDRVLRVDDFGLGEDVDTEISNTDTHTTSGFYFGYGGAHVSATPGTNPFPSINSAFGMVAGTSSIGSASEYLWQVASVFMPGAPELAFRAKSTTAAGWSSWTTLQEQGDVLDDLNTLGASTADGEFLVATGAGAVAWESGSTARDSMGLGTGDSPTLTGLTLSGGEYTFGSHPQKVERIVIGDDAVGTFTLPSGVYGGLVVVNCNIQSTNVSSAFSGFAFLDAGSTPASQAGLRIEGTSLSFGTGVLTGTTGADGTVSVHPQSDQTIDIENRSGGSKTFTLGIY